LLNNNESVTFHELNKALECKHQNEAAAASTWDSQLLTNCDDRFSSWAAINITISGTDLYNMVNSSSYGMTNLVASIFFCKWC